MIVKYYSMLVRSLVFAVGVALGSLHWLTAALVVDAVLVVLDVRSGNEERPMTDRRLRIRLSVTAVILVVLIAVTFYLDRARPPCDPEAAVFVPDARGIVHRIDSPLGCK